MLKICKILNKLVPPKNRGLKVEKYEELLIFVEDRLGHDRRYVIDANKIHEELVWKPKETFESGLLKKQLNGTSKKFKDNIKLR